MGLERERGLVEGRAVLRFPVRPVFVAGEDCVDHSVVEFSILAGLQVAGYLGFGLRGPLCLLGSLGRVFRMREV